MISLQAITDTLVNLADKVRSRRGIESADLERMARAERGASERIAAIEDQLSGIHQLVTQDEGRILHRKREYDKATGLNKRFFGSEIESMVRQLASRERVHAIYLRGQDAVFTLLSKIQELKALLSTEIKEEEIDVLGAQLDAAIEAAKSAQQALRDVNNLDACPPEPKRESDGDAYNAKEASDRLARLQVPAGEGGAEQTRSRAGGLTDETAAFLRQLESEQP